MTNEFQPKLNTMNLNFNEITNDEGLISFVEKYINTPEELVIATMLFTKLNPI